MGLNIPPARRRLSLNREVLAMLRVSTTSRIISRRITAIHAFFGLQTIERTRDLLEPLFCTLTEVTFTNLRTVEMEYEDPLVLPDLESHSVLHDILYLASNLQKLRVSFSSTILQDEWIDVLHDERIGVLFPTQYLSNLKILELDNPVARFVG